MARVFDLDLTLHDSAPRVWRRVRVPADLSLAVLHRAIQVVMRWDDVHPHVFDVDGREYGPAPEEEEISLHWAADDADITVAKAVKKDARFEYTYDFAREQRIDIGVIGEHTGMRAQIECLAGEGDGFDLAETNTRLAEEFQAARVDNLVADLTLLLLYLGSWEEGRGSRSANKTLRVEILESLTNSGLAVTNPHRKSLDLTDAGVKRAEDLLRRVTPLLRG
jgi:pRiA4b ORF-3-like protein